MPAVCQSTSMSSAQRFFPDLPRPGVSGLRARGRVPWAARGARGAARASWAFGPSLRRGGGAA
eukprot:11192179-Lingulodinium_polyedra.AAC.1